MACGLQACCKLQGDLAPEFLISLTLKVFYEIRPPEGSFLSKMLNVGSSKPFSNFSEVNTG
jgi:hypothetical protein